MPEGMEDMNINYVHGINNDTYNKILIMVSVVKSLKLQLRQQLIIIIIVKIPDYFQSFKLVNQDF